MIEPPPALAAGTVLHGRYEVLRCIRAGGMGAVYEVLDRGTRRRRALKTMHPRLTADAESRARFELEAHVTAEVESGHLVEVFDAGVDEATSLPFLVMELLKGEDLGAVLRQRGRLPPAEVVALLHQVALALDRTHAAGVVHRDLKPENLFVTRNDDGSPHMRILDFGIAKIVVEGSDPLTTRSVGTPVYMAPEQIRGDGAICPRADLYALGHIAYALLAGRAYHADVAASSRGIYAVLLTVMDGPREPASTRATREGVELPPAFDAWFGAATATSPEERFDHATTMIDALADALAVARPRPSAIVDLAGARLGPGGAHTAQGVTHDAVTPRRRSWLTPLLAGAALLALGVAVIGRTPPQRAGASAGSVAEGPVAVGSAETAPVTSTIPPPPAASAALQRRHASAAPAPPAATSARPSDPSRVRR